MALFKICRGSEVNLPSQKNDGWAYFCTDTGNFFIDWADTTGLVSRAQINSNCSYSLRYLDGEEYVELDAAAVYAHINDTENPHGVTKAQVGLGYVDNTSDIDKPVSTAQSEAIADAKKAGADAQSTIDNHIADQSNPHSVTAEQVGARPDTWMPSAEEVGADPEGTAGSLVGTHNTNTEAHNDIRLLVTDLTNRLNALADSDDATLDQLSEIVTYIKGNKDLIDSITTDKVNVADIIDNLETNVSNKPLSAAQGVVLKQLIDDFNVDERLTPDTTLSIEGKAADAKAVGDALAGVDLSGLATKDELNAHLNDTNNPHAVTIEQLGVTATADELNYVGGVTSSIQTQIDQLSTNIDGKAPAGYGLGEFAKLVTSLSEITSSGFYTIVSDELPTANGWWGIASIHNARYGTLICESLDGWLIKFTLAHGVWGPIEYVNPPMIIGVEYRTTDRWNGKVVYALAVSCGVLPNNATKAIENIIPASLLDLVDERYSLTDGRYQRRTKHPHLDCRIDGTDGWKWISLTATSDLSGWTATAFLKYTKS